MSPVRAWFYDSWGFLALANRRDPDHAPAVEGELWRKGHGVLVATSDYVLDETLTALHAAAGARVALEFLDLFEARVAAEALLLVQVTSMRRERALERFRRLAPSVPRLSLTDSTSFAVMEELGIRWAFTGDRHFRRAGSQIQPLFAPRGRDLAFVAPPPEA